MSSVRAQVTRLLREAGAGGGVFANRALAAGVAPL